MTIVCTTCEPLPAVRVTYVPFAFPDDFIAHFPGAANCAPAPAATRRTFALRLRSCKCANARAAEIADLQSERRSAEFRIWTHAARAAASSLIRLRLGFASTARRARNPANGKMAKQAAETRIRGRNSGPPEKIYPHGTRCGPAPTAARLSILPLPLMAGSLGCLLPVQRWRGCDGLLDYQRAHRPPVQFDRGCSGSRSPIGCAGLIAIDPSGTRTAVQLLIGIGTVIGLIARSGCGSAFRWPRGSG
ncbi:hypothetical protein Mrad2831_6502 (plasmid) [Methylobacterium radiotolerans JCM 2831]|uniref:Uncharacterized protein n=1 Tax=Methylobacterium radiotolerans (strain ATCC 27329 / DSM 1819 / JCM 2831 / NBRC 15690 / NCIMB 10815 / 0-1) TaxID=426355 RepID=B1MA89_METRJ|nr:hypothetical protein Mrad2831_6502 [Methylobacterium radiotolerans JCM 2831]